MIPTTRFDAFGYIYDEYQRREQRKEHLKRHMRNSWKFVSPKNQKRQVKPR